MTTDFLRRPLTAAAIAAVSLTMLAACGDDSPSTTQAGCDPAFTFPTINDGELTIAAPDSPPYYSETSDGQEGIDADFLNAFGEAACLDVNWVLTPSASVIESVASRRADIAAGGWYATEERGEVVNQSDPIYVELPTIFATNSTDQLDDLVGKRVGTVTGYAWVDELTSVVGADEVSEYQSSDAALADLAAGRLDYAFLGSIDGPYLISTNDAYSGITSEVMAPDDRITVSVDPSLPNYPATKGNDELTDALNQQIQEYHDNGDEAAILESYGLPAELADTAQFED